MNLGRIGSRVMVAQYDVDRGQTYKIECELLSWSTQGGEPVAIVKPVDANTCRIAYLCHITFID